MLLLILKEYIHDIVLTNRNECRFLGFIIAKSHIF